jgi:hypothetical protein
VPVAAAGWKAGTSVLRERRRRAARGSRCPRSGTGSGGAGPMYLPWTCRLVIDLSCTRRIPAPVTCMDHQAAKSASAAASEVPGRLAQIRREAPEAFHLQRPYHWPNHWPTLDQGAGESPLVVDGNPGNWTDVPARWLASVPARRPSARGCRWRQARCCAPGTARRFRLACDPPGRDRLRSEAEPPLSGVFMVSPGSLAWLAQMGFLSPTSAV